MTFARWADGRAGGYRPTIADLFALTQLRGLD